MLTSHFQLDVNNTTEPRIIKAPIKNSEKIVLRDERGRILPGQGALPGAGRPSGSLDFKTKWLRVLDKLAEKKGIPVDDLEEQLFATAFSQAVSGSFNFYKDIQDRVYGKVTENIDMNVKTELPEATPLMLKKIAEYEEAELDEIRAESDKLLTPTQNEPSPAQTTSPSEE